MLHLAFLNEQSESNSDGDCPSSIAPFASERSIQHSLIISTETGVKSLCVGCNKPHRTSS